MTWAANSSNDFFQDTISLEFDRNSSEGWTLLTMVGDRASDMLDLEGATVYYNNSTRGDEWQLTSQAISGGYALVLSQKSPTTPGGADEDDDGGI